MTTTMKTIYLPFYALGLAAMLTTGAMAQDMVVPVPSNSQVVNQGNQNGNGVSYWNCNNTGGTITNGGNSNTIYADRTANVKVEGNNNTVYSVSTGTITVEGNGNVVYTNASSSVAVTGNNNDVYAPTGITVSFDGNNNTRHTIASVRFDYSNAPGGNGGNCGTVTATSVLLKEGVLLQPNPVGTGDVLTLATDKDTEGAVELADLQGRIIRTYEPGSRQLSLRDIPVGFYRVRFTMDSQPKSMPVVVE